MTASNEATDRFGRLADAVQAADYDVDLSSVSVRPDYTVGRPRREQSAAVTHPVAVRLTEADRSRLAAFAESTGQPVSVVIRSAITDWLDRHPAA